MGGLDVRHKESPVALVTTTPCNPLALQVAARPVEATWDSTQASHATISGFRGQKVVTVCA